MGEAGALTRRSATPWIVWGAGLVAYIAAVVHRSSFGVAGLADTVRHPGTWLGFWTHMIGGVSGNVVVLM